MTVSTEQKPAEEILAEEKNKVGSEDKEVTELRKDIKHREQLKEALKENELLKIATEKEKKELLEKAASSDSTAKAMKDKYALAELKAHAVAAGLSDLDCIKMMDTSSLSVEEDGSVTGISEIVAAFKTAKPYLFGAEKKSSSSTNSAVPAAAGAKKKDATTMDRDEWQKELASALANPKMFNS